MRKQINKIIRKHIRVENDDIVVNHISAAIEIEEMAYGFTMWTLANVSFNYKGDMIEIESGREFKSFKHLYKYWRDEV